MKYILILVSFFCLSVNSQSLIYPRVEGWNQTEKITKYNADSLWSIINGAAEMFLRFDFIEMQHSEYTRIFDKAYIESQVYVYKDSESAFGIYSQERPIKSNFIHVGVQGYIGSGSLNFLAGNYYVKLHANNPDTKTIETMQQLAIEMAKTMDASPSFPEILKLFPTQNKIINSEQLIAKEYLGYSYFTNVYQASYLNGKDEYFYFIIIKKNNEELLNLFNQYKKSVKNKVSEIAPNTFKIEDANNGSVYLKIQDQYLLGMYNIKSKKLAKIILK